MFFEGGQGLRRIIGVASGREAEDFSFGGGERANKFAEDRVFAFVGIVAEALPVVVGAAETVAEGEPLTLFTCVRRGAVPGEVGGSSC